MQCYQISPSAAGQRFYISKQINVGLIAIYARARFNRPCTLRAEMGSKVAPATRPAKIETAQWFGNILKKQLPILHGAQAALVNRSFCVICAALFARVATQNLLDVGMEYRDETFVTDLQEAAVRKLLASI